MWDTEDPLQSPSFTSCFLSDLSWTRALCCHCPGPVTVTWRHPGLPTKALTLCRRLSSSRSPPTRPNTENAADLVTNNLNLLLLHKASLSDPHPCPTASSSSPELSLFPSIHLQVTICRFLGVFLTTFSNCLNYKIIKIRSYLKLFFLTRSLVYCKKILSEMEEMFRARYQDRTLSEHIPAPQIST